MISNHNYDENKMVVVFYKIKIKGKKKVNNNDLLIYKKYTELYYYAYKLLEKYPKSERFGLVSDIKNSMNTTLKHIFYAQKVGKQYKMQYLNMIDAELLYQRFSIRLSYNQK